MKNNQDKEKSKELALHYMKTLVDVARESFLILDSRLTVVEANPTFYETFKVTPAETIGQLLYKLGNGQWDIPELKKLLEEILPEKKEVRDYEVTHTFETIGTKTIVLNAKQIDSLILIILALQDVTERRIFEAKLSTSAKLAEEENVRYKALCKCSRDAIMTLEPPDWKFTSGNPATIQLFGAKNESDFLHFGPWNLSPILQSDGRRSDEKAKEMIEQAMREGSNFFEWTHKRVNGDEFPAEVLLSKVDTDGKIFLLALVRDITQRRMYEHKIRQHTTDLEVEVDKQTKELSNQIAELERLNKIMVDRELKMIELKKENQGLKEQLKNKP